MPSGSSKTNGAKWASSTSAGPSLSSSTKYAYLAMALLPNTNNILEYSFLLLKQIKMILMVETV